METGAEVEAEAGARAEIGAGIEAGAVTDAGGRDTSRDGHEHKHRQKQR